MRVIAILCSLFACAGRQLPTRNDPGTAKAFFCTHASDRSECTVDDIDACRSVITVAKADGVFASECVAQPWAWCVVGDVDGKERSFVCAPDADTCDLRREEFGRRGNVGNLGACVKRTVGAS